MRPGGFSGQPAQIGTWSSTAAAASRTVLRPQPHADRHRQRQVRVRGHADPRADVGDRSLRQAGRRAAVPHARRGLGQPPRLHEPERLRLLQGAWPGADTLAGLQEGDQAWVEQKNGAIVRRLVGYGRRRRAAATQALAQLYASSRDTDRTEWRAAPVSSCTSLAAFDRPGIPGRGVANPRDAIGHRCGLGLARGAPDRSRC